MINREDVIVIAKAFVTNFAGLAISKQSVNNQQATATQAIGKQATVRDGRGGSVEIKSQGWKIKWTLRGSFSAVSTPIFASKYLLESFWRDLQDLHAFAPRRP